MVPFIILAISLFLDGLLTNYLPYLVNDLSIFTPLLTLVSIFIIYPLYRKEEKKYLVMLFILGIIYDLLYTNLLFFNAVLFVGTGVLTKKIYKLFEIDFLKIFIYIPIIIISYETATALILITFNIVPITIFKLFYKISHSLLLNIIYGELLHLLIKMMPKKWKKIKIN